MNYSIDWNAVLKEYGGGSTNLNVAAVNTKGASLILGYSYATVSKMFHTGRLQTIKIDGVPKVYLSELKRFADSKGIRDISSEVPEENKRKRFWLRARLYDIYGFPEDKTIIEEAFFWIYNAPLEEWENMVKALEWSYTNNDPENLGLLERGKELYAFLS